MSHIDPHFHRDPAPMRSEPMRPDRLWRGVAFGLLAVAPMWFLIVGLVWLGWVAFHG